MERINKDYKQRTSGEKFRLNFARCAKRDVGRRLIEGERASLFLSFKLRKRVQKREEKKSKISVRLQNVAERENTHLFSGAHIGHSLSVSAYPSKQLRKNVQGSKTIMIT